MVTSNLLIMFSERVGRRALFASALALTSCAVTDPVIHPTSSPTNRRPTATMPSPTMSVPQANSLNVEIKLRSTLQKIAELTGSTEALTAQINQYDAHISFLVRPDPMIGETYTFPQPSPTLVVPTPPADLKTVLAEQLKEADKIHTKSALAHVGKNQPLALLYASLAVCTTNPLTAVPVAGPGAPTNFAASTREATAKVLLTQIWALIYALEVGIGRVSLASPLRAAGLERLGEAKRIRDELLDWPELVKQPEQLVSYKLSNSMNTDEEITEVWRNRELKLLSVWGRVMAASDRKDASYALTQMKYQATQIIRWGTNLPYWPGWV
ncbi:MAG: hypothetical protein CR979_00620 [Propionibacterium sp.]|nr:MAG: hypothetical protein CR979_00620 [Propionibacterium sp.]